MKKNEKATIMHKYIWAAVTIIFIVIVIFPVLVIGPIDLILELFLNKNYVDGWTPGVMVWNGVIFTFAFLFLLKAVSFIIRFIKKNDH